MMQNSLEGKKRHARCDLNTQIITLRETLFNIRARTPTVLNEDYDNGNSPGFPQNGPGGGPGSSSGSYGKHRTSVPASTPVVGSASPIQKSPMGETLISSQNGLVATSSRTYSSTQGRKSPTRVVHVSVGSQQGSQDRMKSQKKALDVRFVPNAQRQNSGRSSVSSTMGASGSGYSERSVSVRGNRTPVQSSKGSSVRRVVFSAHPSKRRDMPTAGQEGNGDEHSDNKGPLSSNSAGTLKRSFSKISDRPVTAADGSLDKRVGISQRLPERKVSNTQKVTFTNIGAQDGRSTPRPSSRASTLITPRGMGETVKAAGALVAGNHPSTKSKHEDNQSTPKINYFNNKSAERRNSNVSSKPKTLFLVRNPFFKLDPSTEKRLEQVESIRLSLQDIYRKRSEKKDKEEEESQTENKDSVDGPGVVNGNTSPKENLRGSPSGYSNCKLEDLTAVSPRSGNGSPTAEAKKCAVTVKVKIPSSRRSSRYSVRQLQTGPITIPGVSGNQLKDLENFHQLMNRKKAVRNSLGS